MPVFPYGKKWYHRLSAVHQRIQCTAENTPNDPSQVSGRPLMRFAPSQEIDVLVQDRGDVIETKSRPGTPHIPPTLV
jgi:hypothetical protein